jgi:hypothetical protein
MIKKINCYYPIASQRPDKEDEKIKNYHLSVLPAILN